MKQISINKKKKETKNDLEGNSRQRYLEEEVLKWDGAEEAARDRQLWRFISDRFATDTGWTKG